MSFPNDRKMALVGCFSKVRQNHSRIGNPRHVTLTDPDASSRTHVRQNDGNRSNTTHKTTKLLYFPSLIEQTQKKQSIMSLLEERVDGGRVP